MLKTGPHVPVTYVAKEVTTLGAMLRLRAKRSPQQGAMFEKQGSTWEETTWEQFYDQARRVAQGLLDLGLKPGDRVAILGPTKAPWAIYDMGVQLAGMVGLGLYPMQPIEQIHFQVDHSEARAVLVDGEKEATRVLEAVAGLDQVLAVVPWTDELYQKLADRDERVTPPSALAGEPLDEDRIDEILGAIAPQDTAILIYTSGTTGAPKGAMITHGNILALLSGQDEFLELYEDDLSFNFLPMAHAAERVLGFFGRINSGVTTAYASSIPEVLQEMKEVSPTLFGSVPRIFEKAYAKIQSETEAKSAPAQQVFAFAVGVARQAARYRQQGRPLPLWLKAKHALADRLVFRDVRAVFGGRARQFITGAAPIALEILEFFWGAGLNVYEVYGMTEATVVTHANVPGQVRLGTVGKVLEPMEHKIADDGEVLVRGPWLFKGYFKDAKATAATVVDGWLHTGDIGTIDLDGYLRITDRKKHMIITGGGKSIAPATVENAIKNQDPLISQVHAHGDKRPYVSALIAPSPMETLELGAERELISSEQMSELADELVRKPSARSEALNAAMAKVVNHPDFVERIKAAVRAGNASLARVEWVKRFVVLDRDFSQKHGELTPTMKVKRKVVEAKHAGLFDRIYSEEGFALEP
jgi:long-chain acyl-CoA synthetase